MTRTRPSLLLVLALAGAVAGWMLELALVSAGRPAVIPPITLGIAVGIIGVLIVVVAWPVFRVTRKVAGARVDPFYATRVVLLAKSSSLVGALVTGLVAAILVFLLTRSVLPAVGSVSMTVVTLVGAVVLLAGALVAEKMCTLPPDDDSSKETPA
jgi:hypothetical protein